MNDRNALPLSPTKTGGLCEPGGCHHTEIEHRAFDDGLLTGERGTYEGDLPTVPVWVREAGDGAYEGWLTGHAVGVSNRSFMQRVVLAAYELARPAPRAAPTPERLRDELVKAGAPHGDHRDADG